MACIMGTSQVWTPACLHVSVECGAATMWPRFLKEQQEINLKRELTALNNLLGACCFILESTFNPVTYFLSSHEPQTILLTD